DDAAPEAAAAAGDDGRLVAQVVHGAPTPPCRCSRRRSRSAGSAPCSAGARAGGRSWGTPTDTPRGRAALGSSPPRAPPSYGARAARSSWERVRLRDVPEPAGARLGAACLRRAVDGHQAEGGAVAEDPLEVVEQAPVDVAADGDPGGEAGEHAAERAPDELDALGVGLGPDAVLGDQDGDTVRHFPGTADGRFQRLGPELVAHLRQAHAALGSEHALGTEAHARVALHTEEVVPGRGLEVDVFHVAPVAVALGF